MVNKTKIKDGMAGFLIASLFLIPIGWYEGWFGPEPYHGVQDISVVSTETGLLITANFVKRDDCTYETAEVFRKRLDFWEQMDWKNLEHAKDRLAGNQTVIFEVLGEFLPGDTVEVRTRHMCNGIKVDKTFLSERIR